MSKIKINEYYEKKIIMEINTINLVGRAGREPDVRYFESGSTVANFTLAVNRISTVSYTHLTLPTNREV